MTDENNIIKGSFARATPTQLELTDALYALIRQYSGHLTLTTMVGILEVVKADVLDSMIVRN